MGRLGLGLGLDGEDKGPNRARGVAVQMGITVTGDPRMCVSDRMFLYVCPIPLHRAPSLTARHVSWEDYCRVMTAVAYVIE